MFLKLTARRSASLLALVVCLYLLQNECVYAKRPLQVQTTTTAASYKDVLVSGSNVDKAHQTQTDTPVDVDYDYFVFTMTWPGTFCEEKHCKQTPNLFTIHGLWPNYANGSWPAFCNPSYPFTEKEITDLLPQMNMVWPDVLSDNGDDWLWTHEWDKHGTCAAPLLKNEHEYFFKALYLHSENNVLYCLYKQHIYPSSTQTYSIDEVKDALNQCFNGGAYILSCQKSKDYQYSDIFQIELSIDKQFNVIPGAPSVQNCKQDVRLPK